MCQITGVFGVPNVYSDNLWRLSLILRSIINNYWKRLSKIS